MIRLSDNPSLTADSYKELSIVTEANKKFNLNYNYSYLFMAKKNVFHEDYKLIKEKIINDLKKIR